MTGTFDIVVEPGRQLLTVRMSGFFTLADVARYGQAIGAATAQLGGRPERQRMLNDISQMSIQSQEVVDAFQRFLGDPRYGRRKVAFVAGTTLARRQLMRIVGDRDVRTFDTVAAAEAWLLDEAFSAAA